MMYFLTKKITRAHARAFLCCLFSLITFKMSFKAKKGGNKKRKGSSSGGTIFYGRNKKTTTIEALKEMIEDEFYGITTKQNNCRYYVFEKYGKKPFDNDIIRKLI